MQSNFSENQTKSTAAVKSKACFPKCLEPFRSKKKKATNLRNEQSSTCFDEGIKVHLNDELSRANGLFEQEERSKRGRIRNLKTYT